MMSLKGMTEEEKKARKRKQRAKAQRKYYQTHKDYYKNYSTKWARQEKERLIHQIEELTNNWNDLKQYLRSRFTEWIGSKNEIIREGACEDYRILDYMKYLEGGSDVQSNNQNEI